MAEFIDITNEFEDKKEFLRSADRTLGWKALFDEKVLYIYVGTGKRYTRFILQLFPNVRTLYITDILDSINIECILKKTEVFAADLRDKYKLSDYEDYFSHILSIDCFNWFQRDQEKVFESLYHILKFGGTAAILTNLNSPFEDCYKDLIENSVWKYSELGKETIFPRFAFRLNKEDYEKLSTDAGFIIVESQEYYRIYEFDSLMDFYEKCTNFTKSFLTDISPDQRPSFENDYLDHFKKLNGLSYRRRPRFKCKTLSMFIRKPVPPEPAEPAPPAKSEKKSPPAAASSSSTSTTFNPFSFCQFGRF